MEVAQKDKRSQQIEYVLLALLLVLRYPIFIAAGFDIIDQSISLLVYLCGTYLCTGLFLCAKRKSLDEFNITLPSIVIFLVAPVVSLLTGTNDITVWARVAMAVCFGLFLFKKKDLHVFKSQKKSVIVNTIFTFCLSLIVPVIVWGISGFEMLDNSMNPVTISSIFAGFGFQLSFAAVSEEPLFRGFLWGYLRKKRLNEWVIGLIIALLFWMGHIYYLGLGVTFWVVHPLVSMLISIVIIKTKSIAHSMVFHTSVNAISDALRFISL